MQGDRSISSVLDVYRVIAVSSAALITAILVLCLAGLAAGFGQNTAVDVLIGIVGLLAAVLLITMALGYGALRRRVGLVEAAKNAALAAASSDALTGALNRSYFIEQLSKHVHFRARQAVSYLQVDMDNLKVLNDTHGHGAGDAALVHLVNTLRALMPNAIIGRLGGDEFGVAILGHDSKAALKRVGAELLDRLDEPIHIAGRPVRLSATIGMAMTPHDAREVSDLISKADLALYAGKRAGRRAIVAFERDMLGDERHRRFVERELRAAILLNELELHYQPILAADGVTVTSYEGRLHRLPRLPSGAAAAALPADARRRGLTPFLQRRSCVINAPVDIKAPICRPAELGVDALDVKRINDHISVSGQIAPEDVAALKAQGYTTIINNRPDGEAPDQPAAAEIEAAAKAAGLAYHHIPLGRTGVTPEMVEQTKAAIAQSQGPVFAFCRSGTRSTTLWALSQAGQMEAGEIIDQAAHAGYDMSHLAGHLGQK